MKPVSALFPPALFADRVFPIAGAAGGVGAKMMPAFGLTAGH